MRGERGRPADGIRGVSIAITHALTIAITTVLLGGLLIGSGTFIDSQERQVADQQLQEIANHVASQVATLDSQTDAGENVTASVTLEYPDAIANEYDYTVALNEDAVTSNVTVRADGLDREASVFITTETSIEASETDGSTVELSLCEDTITLEGYDP